MTPAMYFTLLLSREWVTLTSNDITVLNRTVVTDSVKQRSNPELFATGSMPPQRAWWFKFKQFGVKIIGLLRQCRWLLCFKSPRHEMVETRSDFWMTCTKICFNNKYAVTFISMNSMKNLFLTVNVNVNWKWKMESF